MAGVHDEDRRVLRKDLLDTRRRLLNNEHDDIPHTLLPLTLAVGLVRHKGGYAERQVTEQGPEGDFNMLAGFIAATVPLYEYSTNASTAPRALRKAELEGGMFRNGAKELRFIDGRATKRCLAVNATDVECILALLRDPQNTAQIRSRFVRQRAQQIKARSTRLIEISAVLRREARDLRSSCSSEGPMQPDPCCGGRRARAGQAHGAGPSRAG
jgi:hypothetical protein